MKERALRIQAQELATLIHHVRAGLVVLLLAAIVGAAACEQPPPSVTAQPYPTAAPAPAPLPPAPPTEPRFATKVERGAWLFTTKGCPACHGEAGRGGVLNPNYIADTVPALKTLAERMMLFEREDAQAVIAMIEQGRDPAMAAADPPFTGYPRFLAQYAAVRGVITNGSRPGKKDINGPEPPLVMLPWASQLDSEDMNAIIAYLLALYDWDGAQAR